MLNACIMFNNCRKFYGGVSEYMSSFKKFISVILAMALTWSVLAVGANAAYTSYKDSAIATQFNGIDEPVLTTAQYASAACDELDRMLNKADITQDVYVGTLDLTSLDAAFDSIYTLVNSSAFNAASSMLGDLKDLDADALKSIRRGTTGKTDTDVIYCILQFLYDNKGLISSFIDGSLDAGKILPMFIDLDKFNVNTMAKSYLYEYIYSGQKAPTDISTYSIDTMVQQLIDNIVVNGYTKEDGTTVEGLIPALSGYTDISSGSTYDFLDNALKVVYNGYAVNLLNTTVKAKIQEYLATTEGAKYAAYINADYTVPAYTFTSTRFIDDLNNVVGSIITAVLNTNLDFTWQSGSLSTILTNVVNFAKKIFTSKANPIAGLTNLKTEAELNAMTTKEVCAYAFRVGANLVSGVSVPETCTTIREVASEFLKDFMATEVPDRDYSSYPSDNTDTIIRMGLDLAVYNLNYSLDMGLSYGQDLDTTLTAIINWVVDNYGGLLSGVTLNANTGWGNINKLFNAIIPVSANWIAEGYNGDAENVVVNGIINNILDLDIDGVRGIIAERSDSELQQPIKTVIVHTIARVLNVVFPGAMSTSASTFDEIASNSALASTVDALFSDLYNYRTTLAAAVLPIVCNVLSLTTAQNFKYPDLTYDAFNYISSKAPNFTIGVRNNSTGINTGYTNAAGVFTEDSLYTYDIKSVTSSLATVKVSNPGEIKAGSSADIAVTGTFTGNQSVVITMTYDVLTEDGTALTSTPIKQYIYLELASTSTDVETEASGTAGGYTIKGSTMKTVYVTNPSDITNIKYKIVNTNKTGNVTATPYSAITTIPYVATSTKTSTILSATDNASGQGYVSPFVMSDDYTGSDEQIAAAQASTGTSYVCGRYTGLVGATIGSTNVTATQNIVIYNDYGLEKLLTTEMNSNRQAVDYTSSTAWDTYVAAVQAAVGVVYFPKMFSTFCLKTGAAAKMEATYTSLKAAVDALEECKAGGNVQTTIDLMEQQTPSNEDADGNKLSYDDANYHYFSMSDYKPYTYLNYRDAVKDANSMVNGAVDKDLSTETSTVYKPVNSLTITYNEHRLNLFYSRLLPGTVTKIQLASVLSAANTAGYVETEYSTDSWAAYQKALTFATTVNTTDVSSLKQSKVNRAYTELVDAQKALVKAETEPDEPTYVPDTDNYDIKPVEQTEGNDILTGAWGDDEYAGDVSKLFSTLTGCHAELDASTPTFGTGAIVNIINDTTNEVIKTYDVSVFADVNTDNYTDSADTSLVDIVGQGLYEFSANGDSAYDLAADVNGDASIDASDVALLDSVSQGIAAVDYQNSVISYQ